MLTEKQRKLLVYLEEYQNANGISPSFDEMSVALSLKSKSGIHQLLNSLEERGFVKRLKNRARAIEVIRTNLQPGNFARTQEKGTQVEVPLMGRIAAGTPIEAIADESNYIDVPQNFISRGNYYALEVSGDSMIYAGIMDGDTVIIKRVTYADKGDIVVALVNQEEATLKYFHPESNQITLRAANPRYADQHYGPDNVEIQGKLHALLRQY